MSEADYKAISNLIEEILGDDTVAAVKLMEGIKFYFEHQERKLTLVKESTPYIPDTVYTRITGLSESAQKAMDNYTEGLKKENLKFSKKKTEKCFESS